MKALSSLFFLSLLLMTGQAWAQGAPEKSGIYQVLNLGVDSATGIVTGYYQDGPGDEDADIEPHFTCVFYLSGKKTGDKFVFRTWSAKEANPVNTTGELYFLPLSKEKAKPAINIKLSGKLTDGCWQANPALGKPEGSKLTLARSGDWTAVRIVTADKAFFFETPQAAAPKKSHLNKGDVVVVMDKQPGWLLVDNLIRDKGWVKEADFLAVAP